MEKYEECGVDSRFLAPEKLWHAVEPLLPEEPPKPKAGRPREDARKMLNAIFISIVHQEPGILCLIAPPRCGRPEKGRGQRRAPYIRYR